MAVDDRDQGPVPGALQMTGRLHRFDEFYETDRWLDRYVGLPFVDGGREFADGGFDCWGLVRRILVDDAGVDVPSYSETPAADLGGVERDLGEAVANPALWQAVTFPRRFDVALMRGRSARGGPEIPAHVGIMVDGVRVIHTEIAISAAVVAIAHPMLRYRIVGFYRHAGLK